MKSCRILLAEDDETDAYLLRRAFHDAGEEVNLEVASDGQDAIERIERCVRSSTGRLPSLIVLDLKMPRRDGIGVLEWLRDQEVLRCIPTILFSSSDREEDTERAFAMGANAYLVKPASVGDRNTVARFLASYIRLNLPPAAAKIGYRSALRAHKAYGLLLGEQTTG
ncbi:MAG: response regulator [Acidobacteriota bacterium]|nr:response regulator [Acidobacteriota bacterium]